MWGSTLGLYREYRAGGFRIWDSGLKGSTGKGLWGLGFGFCMLGLIGFRIDRVYGSTGKGLWGLGIKGVGLRFRGRWEWELMVLPASNTPWPIPGSAHALHCLRRQPLH